MQETRVVLLDGPRQAGKTTLAQKMQVEDDSLGAVGVKIKASATVTPKAFSGLRLLAEATGANFRTGIVLYDGNDTLPLGNRLWAAPISSLWQAE